VPDSVPILDPTTINRHPTPTNARFHRRAAPASLPARTAWAQRSPSEPLPPDLNGCPIQRLFVGRRPLEGRAIITSVDFNKSSSIRGFTLTQDQRGELIAFLQSLTDEVLLRDPRFSNAPTRPLTSCVRRPSPPWPHRLGGSRQQRALSPRRTGIIGSQFAASPIQSCNASAFPVPCP
jgi:hypothetical protein